MPVDRVASENPYLTLLDSPLEPGSEIAVRGALVGNKYVKIGSFLPNDISMFLCRFDINLSLGPDMVYRKNTGDDVALHISYSRGSAGIILNSFQGGVWQQEEHYDGSSIREEALFEIRIVVQPDRFEVWTLSVALPWRHG